MLHFCQPALNLAFTAGPVESVFKSKSVFLAMGEWNFILGEYDVDLSRPRAGPSARLGHFSFERDGAFPARC